MAAHHSLGVLLFYRRDFDQAEHEYREALRVRPSEPEVNMNLGNLLLAKGQPAEALASFQRARDAAPHDSLKVNNVAIALAILKRFDESESLLRSALETDTSKAGLLRGNLGTVLLDKVVTTKPEQNSLACGRRSIQRRSHTC